MAEIQQSGFGNGFSKEVEAILEVSDRGLLYPREVRENLARAGMIIYEEVPLPDIPPPDFGGTDQEQYADDSDDTEEPS